MARPTPTPAPTPAPAPAPTPTPRRWCGTCDYWQIMSEDGAFGSCHRRCPPMCGTGGFALWHRTLCGDWCGEWEKRDD